MSEHDYENEVEIEERPNGHYAVGKRGPHTVEIRVPDPVFDYSEKRMGEALRRYAHDVRLALEKAEKEASAKWIEDNIVNQYDD
jgi:hypothetical protein